jgi:hypothetical protein
MKNFVLGAAIGSVLVGMTQTTNPVLASDMQGIGLSASESNPIPSAGWYTIGAGLFGLYLFMLGGK